MLPAPLMFCFDSSVLHKTHNKKAHSYTVYSSYPENAAQHLSGLARYDCRLLWSLQPYQLPTFLFREIVFGICTGKESCFRKEQECGCRDQERFHSTTTTCSNARESNPFVTFSPPVLTFLVLIYPPSSLGTLFGKAPEKYSSTETPCLPIFVHPNNTQHASSSLVRRNPEVSSRTLSI